MIDTSHQHTERSNDSVNSRMDTWSNTITTELKSLLEQAGELQSYILSSKTGAKRRYYQKKINKIKPQINQMLNALEMLKNNKKVDTLNSFPV